MRRGIGVRTALLIAVLAAPVVTPGCGPHRVYDPYYSDYHVWNHNEDGYYRRWESDNHKDHVDIGKRSPDDQKAYFTWRHSQK
jgi:hypothetical protein